jgi:hypothetical protein
MYCMIIKHTLFIAALLATSLHADEIPTAAPVVEPRDYSNTLQARTAAIEHVLGITSTSWLCHLPKGFLVTLRWWQTGAEKPLWTSELKTDDLPLTDGYFLTLFQQSPVSTPAEDATPRKSEVGFSTPMGGLNTYYHYLGDRKTTFGSDPKVGQESELWSIAASLDGPPKKHFWMTIMITKL